MPDLILHHYPQSPVSEKVRIAFGFKGLAWQSVIIPRIPPKPKLMPLTGGFRLTPVLQIGADIYCDSQRILLELEQRFPTPTFFADGDTTGAKAFARWTDGTFFQKIIATVFADELSRMPKEFAQDRIALYFGGDATPQTFKDELPNNLVQLRTQFGWIDEALSGNAYLAGNKPGYKDAHAYYLVWFLRGRYPGGDELLSDFGNLKRWADEVSNIGHGDVEEQSEDAALDIATNNEPTELGDVDVGDPLGLEVGDLIAVRPENDENETHGVLIALNDSTVSIKRDDEEVGEIAVHFPRVGYLVRKL